MSAKTTIILEPGDDFPTRAIPTTYGSTIGYVMTDVWTIQSTSSAELRRLATALVEAARLADLIADAA